jgi:uncharacterized protein DUF4235
LYRLRIVGSLIKKLLYLPFKIVAGVLSGMLGRRLYAKLWRVVDDKPAPAPNERRIDVRKLALSLGLQGAVFNIVRGLLDHGSRKSFYAFTHAWPGRDEHDR